MKLWYIGAFFVLMDLFQITYGQNIGGRLAHLGGAVLGYTYAMQLMKGNNIGIGFINGVKSLGTLFKRKEKNRH